MSRTSNFNAPPFKLSNLSLAQLETAVYAKAITRSMMAAELARRASVTSSSNDIVSPECSICRRRHGREVQHACE